MPTKDPIDSFLAAYAAAVLAKDKAAFLALYSSDVVVFDSWDRWEYRGREAWGRMIDTWFGSLGSRTVKVTVKELASRVDANVATGHAILEFAAYEADGKRVGSLENRVTLVACTSPRGWEIVHEHTSIPVPFASAPAMPRH